jgi:hypothetical protein
VADDRGGELGSECLQRSVARSLRVLDAVAEIVELGLYGEPAFLVIDRTPEIAGTRKRCQEPF